MDHRMKTILGSGRCVLDLGCGSGEALQSLAGEFEERIGLDASTRRLDEFGGGTCGWRFELADLNAAFPLEGESADAVIANQTIEHIVDPVHFVSEVYRVLRPGGRCVITTPNVRYLRQIGRLLVSGYGPRTAGGNTLDGTWDDGHVHYFTHQDLRELFGQIGFRRVESRALIDPKGGGQLRRWMDHNAGLWPIREFLSGCILLWAEK